jgi:hypothetical protein
MGMLIAAFCQVLDNQVLDKLTSPHAAMGGPDPAQRSRSAPRMYNTKPTRAATMLTGPGNLIPQYSFSQ